METFDHPFLPNSSAPIRKIMLEAIGVASIDELYSDIPSQVRTNRPLKVDWLPSEQEVRSHIDRMLADNKSASDMPVFLGAGIYKPLLTLLCGLPIVALGLLYPDQVYNPTLQVPIFGAFHLPIIYPLSIPVAISVTSNTTNMLDPLNGTMAGGVSIISAALLMGVLITDPAPSSVFLYASLLFAALGFFYFNRYPSRAFAGNVGQLSIGAALGTLAILSRSEIASIVAMFPNIQNSFFFLSKIKRFTEHRALTAKPTRLLDDGHLASSSDPKAPLTLVRTLLVGRPAKESEIVSTIFGLYLISATLALITMIMIG